MSIIDEEKTKDLVITMIERIRPYIKRDGGDVEVVNIEDGIVSIRMLGACVGCAAIDSTVKDGIEAMLVENVPGIIGVEVVA